MKKSILFLFFVSLLLISGCGSGLEGGDGLSAESRTAVMDSVSEFVAKLPSDSDFSTNLNSLADFLSKRSEFSETGVSEDFSCVWGRFANGWGFVVKTDRPPTIAEDNSTAKVIFPSYETRKISDPNAVERIIVHSDNLTPWVNRPDMPVVAQAKLFHCLESGFGNVVPTIRSWLLASGYSVNNELSSGGTVEDLKTVKGDGIFYIGTHGAGGRFGSNSGKMFCLMTGTRVTPENEPLYKEDLDDQSLVIFETYVNNYSVERRYAITENFVRKYMKFGQNSLVYVDACFGDNENFRKACQEVGASLYISWTGSVYDPTAVRAAHFIFDRMLGMNSMQGVVEDPKQRPFDYYHVYTDLLSRKWNRNPTAEDFLSNSATRGLVPAIPVQKFQVELLMREGSGTCGWLAPSIECMTVDESPLDNYQQAKVNSELTIYGTFGSDPGESGRKVEIEGQELTVLSWTATKIVCELPRTGPRSAGKVQVFSGNRRSNKVPLTEWWVAITKTMKGSGSVTDRITFNCHLRYDVHGFRTVCGPPIFTSLWRILPNIPYFDQIETTIGHDSYATWSSSGTQLHYSNPQNDPNEIPEAPKVTGKTEYVGSGTVSYDNLPGCFSRLRYDSNASNPNAKMIPPDGIVIEGLDLYFHLELRGAATTKIYYYAADANGNHYDPTIDSRTTVYSVPGINLILDGDRYIKSGSVNNNGDNSSITEWSVTPPRFPPDESTGH
jgi:hypothetical protein